MAWEVRIQTAMQLLFETDKYSGDQRPPKKRGDTEKPNE